MSFNTVDFASAIPKTRNLISFDAPWLTYTKISEKIVVPASQSSTTPFLERVHSINWLSVFSLYCTTSESLMRIVPFLSGQPIVESTVIIDSVVDNGSTSVVLYGIVNVPSKVSSDIANSYTVPTPVLMAITFSINADAAWTDESTGSIYCISWESCRSAAEPDIKSARSTVSTFQVAADGLITSSFGYETSTFSEYSILKRYWVDIFVPLDA